jgi:2-deoxy-D-gluconate 3-dehydrogenase
MFDLSGRVALVTGGNRGIGKGIALGLARAGADVVICSRDTDGALAGVVDQIKRLGRKSYGVKCDVTNKEDLVKALSICVANLGGLDILVANSGGATRGTPEAIAEEDMDATMNLNFRSVFLLCQLAYPLLKASGHGKIITIGSMYALHGGSANGIGYACSKHAIIGLTRSLATNWANDHIQVNSLLPGWISTQLTSGVEADITKRSLITQRISDPKGFGDENDMAGPAVFLASSASDYVTGVSLPVDGGFAVTMAPRRPEGDYPPPASPFQPKARI